MKARSGYVRRSGAAILTAGIAAVFSCMTVFAGARYPDEEKAAAELKKALNISTSADLPSSGTRDKSEAEAYAVLLSALDTGSSEAAENISGEADARNDLASILDEALAVSAETAAVETSPAKTTGAEASSAEATAAETSAAETSPVLQENDYPITLAEHEVDLTETDGKLRLNSSDLLKIFPNYTTWSGSYRTENSARSFADSLRLNLAYADLVGGYEKKDPQKKSYSTFPAGESVTPLVFIMDGPTHLCGYCTTPLKDIGEGKWRLILTECDYDFSEQLQKDREDFRETEAWKKIEPDAKIIGSCGASYFTQGYGDSSTQKFEQRNNRQMFRLWGNAKAGRFYDIDKLPGTIERSIYNPKINNMYFALFDSNKNIIGYFDIVGSSIDPSVLATKLRENNGTK